MCALRIVQKFKNAITGRSATVRRDADWDEYRVQHYLDEKHLSKADYHDSNKECAVEHAKYWVNGGL